MDMNTVLAVLGVIVVAVIVIALSIWLGKSRKRDLDRAMGKVAPDNKKTRDAKAAAENAALLAALAAACVAGRGTAVLLMYRHRYAREEGLGNVFIGKVTGRQTCVTLGLAAILAAVLLPGMRGVAALVVTMVAIFILGQLLKRT